MEVTPSSPADREAGPYCAYYPVLRTSPRSAGGGAERGVKRLSIYIFFYQLQLFLQRRALFINEPRMEKGKQGFASMPPHLQGLIASKGGKNNPNRHKFTTEEAKRAGRLRGMSWKKKHDRQT
jgi:hypothetical protein